MSSKSTRLERLKKLKKEKEQRIEKLQSEETLSRDEIARAKDKLEMEDFSIKEKKIDRRINAKVNPGAFSKFINALNPRTPLGTKASNDFEEHSLTISMILIFTLVAGVLLTIMYDNILKEKTASRTEEHMVLAAMVISWFAFTNFFFLIFGFTRLLNIILFIVILGLVGTTISKIDLNSNTGKLGVATIALLTIPTVVLCYYYIFNDSDEIVSMKTLENERARKEKFKALVEQKCKAREAQVEASMNNKYREEKEIRTRLSDALISSIEEGKFPGGGKGKKDKNKKGKSDKKDDGDEEEEE